MNNNNITPQVNPIPEEWNKKPKNNKTIIIVLIVILVLCIIGGSFYFINTNITNKDKKNGTNTTDTTDTTNTTDTTEAEENYTVITRTTSSTEPTTTPKDVLERMGVITRDKEETITKTLNNKEQTFRFTYYYQSTSIEVFENGDFVKKSGYYYKASISLNGKSVNEYIIGTGLTKEEAKNKSILNTDNNIKTINDTESNKEYFLLLVPYYVYSSVKNPIHIVEPTIVDETGKVLIKIQTQYDEYGYTSANDSKYKVTSEVVKANHGSFVVENNTVYYIKEQLCNNSKDILTNVYSTNIKNGKVETTTYASKIIAYGEGASC